VCLASGFPPAHVSQELLHNPHMVRQPRRAVNHGEHQASFEVAVEHVLRKDRVRDHGIFLAKLPLLELFSFCSG
jgi:hypothetical protein